MRIIIFLVISFSLAAAMEPQPLAVVKLDRYTLVASDGKELTLDGNIVREYLPGLADKFREGMLEARTGKIRVNDLDGQALENLKSLLERYIALEQDVNRQKEKLSQLAVEEYLNQEAALNKRLKEQISLKLESLPEIGDHFIALYKELVFWDAPDALAKAMADFAVRHLELGEAYESFKNLDPYAQLLFLDKVALSDDSIIKALEWLIDLQKNPTATNLENFGLFENIRERIIDYIANNIEPILLKHYEKLKKLFKENDQLGNILKKELTKNNPPLYTTTLRKAVRGTRNYIIIDQLSNQLLALRDDSEINNIYDFKTHTFSSSAIFKNAINTFIYWNPNRIISLGAFSPNLAIYDLVSSKIIFEMKPGIVIKKIIPAGENSLLALGVTNNLYLFNYDSQKKLTNKKIVALNVLDVMSVGPETFAIIGQVPNKNIKLILYDAQKGAPLRFTELKPSSDLYIFNTIRRIDADHIGVTFNSKRERDQLFFEILYKIYRISDLAEIASFNFKSSNYEYPTVRCMPMSKQVVLVDYYGNGPVLIHDLRKQLPIRLFNLHSVMVLDENHFAAYDGNTKSFIIAFIPETDSVIEIFDEILRYIPAHKKTQIQKRPASLLRAAPIPAAAQGLKPQERETKRPREEKEKPNG